MALRIFKHVERFSRLTPSLDSLKSQRNLAMAVEVEEAKELKTV
jgi:hypothetical protein